MIIFRCDRCKKEAPLMWTVTLSVENLNPMAQHIPTEKMGVCWDCKTDLTDFLSSRSKSEG
jgi:hypothetical protein